VSVVTKLKPPSERDPGNRGSRPDGCEQRRRLAQSIEACAAGDRAAFRRLYDLSARFVFGVVVTVLGDQGMAEEVTQEVYVTVWKRAGSFDIRKGNPLAWMAAIARNRAIDRLRAERARGFVSYSDEVPDIAGDDMPADLTVDAIAVRRALADLRPEFRDALLLFYFKGYTHSELAGVMNVPVGTAKSWVRRGLAALKETLE
jgi:RNA polymerase sigma-70 factor (ECF subfamily)